MINVITIEHQCTSENGYNQREVQNPEVNIGNGDISSVVDTTSTAQIVH